MPTKTESKLVETEISNNVGWITLNNPKKLNALSNKLINDLCAALEGLQQLEARVVILRAPAGSKVFSAGHDIQELPTNGRDPLTYDDPLRLVVRTIERFPAPVIAMVEGSVWGARLRACNELRPDHCRRRHHICHHYIENGCALQHIGNSEFFESRRHATLQGNAVHLRSFACDPPA